MKKTSNSTIDCKTEWWTWRGWRKQKLWVKHTSSLICPFRMVVFCALKTFAAMLATIPKRKLLSGSVITMAQQKGTRRTSFWQFIIWNMPLSFGELYRRRFLYLSLSHYCLVLWLVFEFDRSILRQKLLEIDAYCLLSTPGFLHPQCIDGLFVDAWYNDIKVPRSVGNSWEPAD